MTVKSTAKTIRLRGNPQERKIVEAPVVAMPDGYDPPTTLSPKAKKVWTAIAPSLINAGILTLGDCHMFAVYCETYAQWMQAQSYVRKNLARAKAGQDVTTLNMRIKLADKTQEQLLSMSAHFGMTPRSRNHVSGKKLDSGNKFAALRAVKNAKDD